MKKALYTIIFIFIFINSNAQVGIGTLSPNSTLTVDGSIATNVEFITGNITLDETHHTVVGNGFTVTLPDPTNIIGREYTIKAGNSGNTSVAPSGTDGIDGSPSTIILDDYESIKVKAVAAGNWIVIKDISGAKKIDDLSDAKVLNNSVYLGAGDGIGANGSRNSGVGAGALLNADGDENIAMGYFAGGSLTDGSNNVLLGHGAGSGNSTGITTGDGNILIGDAVLTSSQTVDNELNIGDAVYATNLYGATANVGIGNGNNAPNSTLSVNGSVSMPILVGTVDEDYTLTDSDYTYLTNGTSTGSADVTLPSAVGREGRIYIIKSVGTSSFGNFQTLRTSNSQTIDGAATFVLFYNIFAGSGNDTVTVQSDGSNWWIISSQ